MKMGLAMRVPFTLAVCHLIRINYQGCFGEKVAERLEWEGNSRNFAA